jgi:hypothetical protein
MKRYFINLLMNQDYCKEISTLIYESVKFLIADMSKKEVAKYADNIVTYQFTEGAQFIPLPNGNIMQIF